MQSRKRLLIFVLTAFLIMSVFSGCAFLSAFQETEYAEDNTDYISGTAGTNGTDYTDVTDRTDSSGDFDYAEPTAIQPEQTTEIITEPQTQTQPPTTKGANNSAIEVTSLTLSESRLVIDGSSAWSLSVSIFPGNADDKTLTWYSSNQEVISVNGGKLTALSSGTAVVTVKSVNGVEASCEITVVRPVSHIYVEAGKYNYKIGETVDFKATFYPEDAPDKSYTVSVTGKARLSDDNKIICSDTGGEATITVTASNGLTGSLTVSVVDLDEFASEVLRLTNIERQNLGLPYFETDGALTKTAVVRAYEIMTFFDHERPNGQSCFTAYDENGVSYRTAGENIAYGQSTPEEVVEGWMNSPGHRANIVNASFGHLGVGVEMDSQGVLYWSQNFTD